MAKPKRDPEPQSLDDLAAEAEAIEAAYDDTDGGVDDETPAPDVESSDVESEIARLTAERDDFKDRFMRALAEAENTRKRADRDRREAENYGGSKLARDLLPVHDALARALDAVPEEAREETKGLIEGVELTMRELLNVFKKHGIQPIDPQVGDRFDPQAHQAMFEAPVPNTKAGDIIQVMAQGFLLHDRLLRPAQVGVSSTPAS